MIKYFIEILNIFSVQFFSLIYILFSTLRSKIELNYLSHKLKQFIH